MMLFVLFFKHGMGSYLFLRIQNLPDRIGLMVPIPSEKKRNVGVIPFLGHTWILRAYTRGTSDR